MLKKAYKRQEVDERERIIDEFLPIIKHLAFKVSRGFDDDSITEDLISSGGSGCEGRIRSRGSRDLESDRRF
jgi:DNA-directed RNA polymerase specialized sigma subunit